MTEIQLAKAAIDNAFEAFLREDWPWTTQVSEDDFKPYQPTEEQMKAEKEEFIMAYLID
jgi:hypothetical protein